MAMTSDGGYLLSPLVIALTNHSISANVVDLEHYRAHGVAVGTHYIIEVQMIGNFNNGEPAFAPFRLSKTFHKFRVLAKKLRKAIDANDSIKKTPFENLSQPTKDILKLSASLTDVIDSEGTSYLGKVNYGYVKHLSKQRRSVIDDALMMIMTCFPSSMHDDPLVNSVVDIIESFFLRDHVINSVNNSERSRLRLPQDGQSMRPFSSVRKQDMDETSALFMDDELVSVSTNHIGKESSCEKMEERDNHPPATITQKDGDSVIERHASKIIILSGVILHIASHISITIDLDYLFLALFAFLSIGKNFFSVIPLKTTTPINSKLEIPNDHSSHLLRRSMSVEIESLLTSPIPFYRPGVDPTTQTNCISLPAFSEFNVRGDRYLNDKKKVPSETFLFPLRGADLFLTDTSPANIGSNDKVFGGRLRESPTFIINFRLPWGVFTTYHEIPAKFLPFLKKKYLSEKTTTPSKKSMTPSERSLCRFLLGNDKHKTSTLKLIAIVVDGNRLVKSVVGGKPAIIGNKIPTTYTYEPADESTGKSEYLELDIDIVSSSTARSILSVCRSYTQTLTIDLGFVVQGNSSDELPEQILTGVRLHGLDPIHAPPFPPMEHSWPNLKEI